MSIPSKNPKLIISNFFDSLIREVDIFTEERLEISENKQITVKKSDIPYEKYMYKYKLEEQIDVLFDFDKVDDFYNYGGEKLWTQYEMPKFNTKRNLCLPNKEDMTIKACDFWNEFRDELLIAINRFQKETFESYETIRDELKSENKLNSDIGSISRRVFENRFAFFICSWLLDFPILHLIELDFYLSPNECQLLS